MRSSRASEVSLGRQPGRGLAMPGPRVALITASGKRSVGWYVAEALVKD